MKLLSTLFATLALTGSVFMAPKAMAADIEVNCSLSDLVNPGYDCGQWGNEWAITFSDGAHTVAFDVETADGSYIGDYNLADCYGNGEYTYFDNQPWTSLEFHIVSGDYYNNVSLYGEGVCNGQTISFTLNYNAGTADIEVNCSLSDLVNPGYDCGQWGNEWAITFSDGAHTVAFDVETADGSYIGDYNLADCYGNGEYTYFDNQPWTSLEFHIVSGDYYDNVSLYGEGVCNGQTISFTLNYTPGAKPKLDIESATLTSQSYDNEYWNICLNNYVDENSLNLCFNGASFAGDHTIANCNAANCSVITSEGSYTFGDDLAFSITGSWGSKWNISGSATITNTTDPSDQIDLSFNIAVTGTDLQITNCGYASYYNPWNAYFMPENVEGYVAYMNGPDFVFEKAYEPGDVVPTGSALVLKNTLEDGVAKDIVLVNTQTSNAKYEPNDLLGTSMNTPKAYLDQDHYVYYALRLGEEGNPESVGFYLFSDKQSIPMYRAYLPVAKSQASARGYAFNGANDLHNIGAEEATTDAIFNINGQRAAEAKGLVVRQGKMMFVK